MVVTPWRLAGETVTNYLARGQGPFELRCNQVMAKSSSRDKMTVRVIRGGQDETLDDSWLNSSPEERIEAVWTSLDCVSTGTRIRPLNPDFKELLLAFNPQR